MTNPHKLNGPFLQGIKAFALFSKSCNCSFDKLIVELTVIQSSNIIFVYSGAKQGNSLLPAKKIIQPRFPGFSGKYLAGKNKIKQETKQEWKTQFLLYL